MGEKRSKKGPIIAGMAVALLMLVGIGGGGIGDGLLPNNESTTNTPTVEKNVEEKESSIEITISGEIISVVYGDETKEVTIEELDELLQTIKKAEIIDNAAIKKNYDEVIELIDKNEVTKIIK